MAPSRGWKRPRKRYVLPARRAFTPLHSRRVLGLSLVVAGLLPLRGTAQEMSGPLLPAGTLRLDVTPVFSYWDSRWGERLENGVLVEEEEPLGFDFSDRAAGARLFPSLQGLQDALDMAIPGNDRIRFGQTSVLLSQSEVRLPLRLDLGLTDWLSIGVTVPLTKRRSEIAFGVTADSANLGRTPLSDAPTQVSNFLSQIDAAVNALARVADDTCQAQGASSPACLEAVALLNDGSLFRDAMNDAYVGHGVFPLAGSSLGDALAARVAALGQAFAGLGVNGFPGAVPLATTPITAEAFQEMIAAPGLGVEGDPLELFQSDWEIGDIEVFGHARLLEGDTRDDTRDPGDGIGYQVGAGALVRLGTGSVDSDSNFIDLGSGQGHPDLELQGFVGLRVGPRLGAWLDVRYGIQGTTELFRRAEAPDRGFPALTTRTPVRWTPGNYFTARLTPRIQVNEVLALALDLRRYSKAQDTYERLAVPDSVAAQPGGDPSLLELETEETTLDLGFGLIYSTLRERRAGKTDRRVELSLLFQSPLSGSGGRTPKASRVQIGVRLFRSFWGRGS